MPLTCRCGAEINPEVKPPTIVNTPDVSLIIVANVRASCPNPACRAVYVQQIQESNIRFAWPLAPPESKPSGLVYPVGVVPGLKKLLQGE